MICYISLSGKFPGRVVKTAFHDITGTFWDESSFSLTTKTFVNFRLQKLMDCFQKKSLPVLSKQHSAFREQLFEAKWCFWREYVVMLFMLSGRWEKNFGCSPKQFGHVRQILTPRVQSNVFRKHRFFKKTKFFWQFQELERWFLDFGKTFFYTAMGVPTGTFSDFAWKFFNTFGFWLMFLLTCGGKITAGLLKLQFFSSEKLSEAINFENVKHVSRILDSDQIFFIILTSVFPQHCVNCILYVQKNNWRDFVSLKTPGIFCQFRFLGNRIWALFPKNFWPDLQNSIRRNQSKILRKNKFFKETFFFWIFRTIHENFPDFWQKKWSEG